MEGYSEKEQKCPQLLDLIPKDCEFLVKREEKLNHRPSEENKLELRLGPPGEDCTIKAGHRNTPGETDKPILFLGYFSDMASMIHNTNINTTHGEKKVSMDAVNRKTIGDGWITDNNGNHSQKFPYSESPVGPVVASPWSSSQQQQQEQQTKASFLQLQSNPQSLPPLAKESSHPSSTRVADLKNAEKKALSPISASTAVPNISQKRPAPTSFVGWPPVRSSRKNLASGSTSKPAPESRKVLQNDGVNERTTEGCRKGKFVKIYMDGVPIGRKVDLHAHDSYEKLSSVVDELFRGLLTAQCDTSAAEIQNKKEGEKAITGLLDGSGEYTLVYEDHEGDRMLVGDVPWHMFVSTVKRLRVLKSSELPKLWLGSKQEKAPVDAAF